MDILNSIDGGNGLSPRVRGSLEIRGVLGDGDRSIPACAGEPLESPAAPCAKNAAWRACHGLSPRVRGSRLLRRTRDF